MQQSSEREIFIKTMIHICRNRDDIKLTLIGIDKYDLDTPSLLIDLDIMDRNISTMAEYFKGVKADLRPHVKDHKSPIIAKKQIEAGAIGIACQKLGEAEVMAASGLRDILITNQIANEQKINRLIGLVKHSNVIVGVDNFKNVKQLSSAAIKKRVEINVALELDAGRCGIQAGKPAVSLAKEIMRCKGLKFRGIWFHKGLGYIKKFEERRRIHLELLKSVIETRDMIEDAGINVEIVSAGATSTYNITPEVPEITEVQPGSYIFMSSKHRNIEGLEPFNCALIILATIISRPSRDRAIIDVGLKSRGCNYQALIPPLIKNIEGVEVTRFSAEHGHLKLKSPSRELEVGDKLELIPSECGTTVNMYDEYVGIREGIVEVIWPILGRGKAQ